MSAKKKGLPSFIRDFINSRPTSGNGVHFWLFKAARYLHRYRSEEEIFQILRAAVQGCGRDVPDREIQDAISNSRSLAWKPGVKKATAGTRKNVDWPAKNPQARESAIQSSELKSLEDLVGESPVDCDPQPRTEDIIDALMPGNPLICVGMDKQNFKTRRREELRGDLSKQSLIVPSPMTDIRGMVKGKSYLSEHTLDNTGPRHYLVTEFDSGDADEQAALIWHLSHFAPLVMVVHSGGKSLHAWWECAMQTTPNVKLFMDYAVSLGADTATWTRSQFVRMPGGLRDGKLPQRVHYFDPNAGKEFP